MKNYWIFTLILLSIISASSSSADKTSSVIADNTLTPTSAPIILNHNVFQDSTHYYAPKIVGGTEASEGEYPEYTIIFKWREATDKNVAGYYLKCGGSLISENKVLTAAHCVDEGVNAGSLFVVPNFHSLTGNNAPLISSRLIQISQIDIHPKYSTNTITNLPKYDVAVLTMTRDSDEPLTLLYAGSDPFAGHIATSVGMGAMGENSEEPVGTLREVNLPIVRESICSQANPDITIERHMLCAGYSSGGLGLCHGDSGGPLLLKYKRKRIQVGIASFSRGCDRLHQYIVYSRVNEVISFIREHASVITVIDRVPVDAAISILLGD